MELMENGSSCGSFPDQEPWKLTSPSERGLVLPYGDAQAARRHLQVGGRGPREDARDAVPDEAGLAAEEHLHRFGARVRG